MTDEKIEIHYSRSEIDGVQDSHVNTNVPVDHEDMPELSDIMDAYQRLMDKRHREGRGDSGKLELTF
jgi:hypothetical protein